MPRYIEAEKLEKEGWFAARNYQRDEKTMVFESKKMTDFPAADVVERKDLDEIIECHENIGFEQGYRDGYAQAVEDAIEAVGINTWAGSKITQLKIVQMNGENR